MKPADFSALDAAGLNLHAVFDLSALPEKSRDGVDPDRAYAQLLLIGNGGRALWSAIEAEGLRSADPIDDYSVRCVEDWLAREVDASGQRRWRIVYPGTGAGGLDLQALGERAGWHCSSPFMLGINARWGSWFAYRVAVLADSDFAPTPAWTADHPCASCAERRCIAACPAGAADAAKAQGGQGYSLQRCIDYRRQAASACAATCVARLACPVAAEQRYSAEQLRHSYSISLAMIERYCR